MSVFQSDRSVPLGSATTHQITNVFEKAVAAVRGWYLARSTMQALEGLSDRELADIGVARGEIPHLADRVSGR